jgi:hypothetical protein
MACSVGNGCVPMSFFFPEQMSVQDCIQCELDELIFGECYYQIIQDKNKNVISVKRVDPLTVIKKVNV